MKHPNATIPTIRKNTVSKLNNSCNIDKYFIAVALLS
jgi:hypothetical protein